MMTNVQLIRFVRQEATHAKWLIFWMTGKLFEILDDAKAEQKH